MEWINFKDRLPDKEYILGCNEEGMMHSFFDKDNPWHMCEWNDFQPTHWIPLPEPPEEYKKR
jgi:hypothetical protein